MTESDALAVSQIVASCYRLLTEREGYSEEQLTRLLAECCSEAVIRERWVQQWECYAAEWEGSVVGALAIERNDVAELWVSPEHHRKGIGTALFKTAEQCIAQAGFRTLTLCCAAHGARPFYEAMGLKAVDTQPCRFGPLEGWPLTYYSKQIQNPQKAQPSHPADRQHAGG
jgi:GNAT superfamily N-acetyltransferase